MAYITIFYYVTTMKDPGLYFFLAVNKWYVLCSYRLELTRMLLTMNASVPLADKFHKNTGKTQFYFLNSLMSL